MVKWMAMETIEALVKAGKYAEAVALKNKAESPKDKFLLISAFLSLGKAQEGMDFLLANRSELYASNPVLTLKTNFEIRYVLKQFDEAYEDYDEFANLPYVSQEVEEQLRALPKAIRTEERLARGKVPVEEEEAHRILGNTKDGVAILALLNGMKKADITPYFEDLHTLLNSEVHNDVKRFSLMLLAAKNDHSEVKISLNGTTHTLVPSELKSPYQNPLYLSLKERLSAAKEISVAEIALQLLDQYALLSYPFPPYLPLPLEKESAAFIALAHRYLQSPVPGLEPELQTESDRIFGVLNAEKPLSF